MSYSETTYVQLLVGGAVIVLLFVIIYVLSVLSDRRAERKRGPFVNEHAKCPCCGLFDGKLKMVLAMADNNEGMRPFVQHTCNRCGAEWGEPTVVKHTLWWKAPTPK